MMTTTMTMTMPMTQDLEEVAAIFDDASPPTSCHELGATWHHLDFINPCLQQSSPVVDDMRQNPNMNWGATVVDSCTEVTLAVGLTFCISLVRLP